MQDTPSQPSYEKSDKALIGFCVVTFILSSLVLYFDYSNSGQKNKNNFTPIGKVSNFSNTAKRKFSDSMIWYPARKNGTVYLNDWIFTGSDSEATITFKDGGQLVVKPNSIIVLRQLDGLLDIDLTHGKIIADIKKEVNISVSKGKKKQTYKTSAGEFKIANTKKNQKLEAIRGSLKLIDEPSRTAPKKNIADKKTKLKDGLTNTAINKETQAESSTVNLLTPKNNKGFMFKETLNVELEILAETPGNFIFEIASSEDFSNAESIKTKLTKLNHQFKKDGIYFWRARVDQQGSSSSEIRKINLISDTSPTLTKPLDKSEIIVIEGGEEAIGFEWSDQKQKWLTYDFEIALDENFLKPIDQRSDLPMNILPLPLEKGATYFWRVRGRINEFDITSSWSTPKQFKLLKEPRTPLLPALVSEETIKYDLTENDLENLDENKIIDLTSKEDKPVLTWTPQEKVSRYKLTLSRTQSFESIDLTEEVSSNKFSLNQVPVGNVFYKVEPLGPLGDVGPAAVGKLKAYFPEPSKLKTATVDNIRQLQWTSKGSSFAYLVRYRENSTSPWNYEKVKENSMPAPWPNRPFQWQVRSYDIENKTGVSYYSIVGNYEKSSLDSYERYQRKMASIADKGPHPQFTHPEKRKTFVFEDSSSPFIIFRWKYDQPNEGYEFQVSKDPRFKQLVVQKDLPSIKKMTFRDQLAPGIYFYRLRAKDSKGPSDWSTRETFRFQKIKGS